MSNFKAKMHQIRFRLGLRTTPRWGAYSALQTPYLDLRGLLLRAGEEGEGREGEEWKGGSFGP